MERETNFMSFFHSYPDMLFVLDAKGIIIEANNTASDKLGYPSPELNGKSIYLLRPAELRSEAERCFKEILSGMRSFCPLPLETKSGKLLSVETVVSEGQWDGKDVLFAVSKDVTEKRKVEEIARNLETRYRILFGNINDAVFVHELIEGDLPGKFFEVNDVACKRLGYSREELLNMSPEDIDPPENYLLVPSIMSKLKEEKHIVWEGAHLTKSGNRIPVEISNHLFNMDGRPIILATVRDITERKRTEALLIKSEVKYRKIFENIQDIFYQADLEGRIMEISPSIERYSGYKPEELIGKRIEEVYLNPADRGDLLKVLSENGEVEDYILKLKTKDKPEVFVSANIHILNGTNGEPVGIEGSLRDVSERINDQEKLQKSEQLLRRQNEEYAILNEELKRKNSQILLINKELQQAKDIFMNIRTGLYIYQLEDINDDRSLKMISVNPAAERLTGIKAAELIGKTIDENFPGLREKGIPSDYADVARTKISRQFEEIIYNDSRIISGAFSFNAFPLPENCVGVSFENVTDQVRAKEAIIESNRQLKSAKEKAEESDRLKSSFLANMSHEIRTPMNGILGFSVMLADPALPQETRESYIKIVNSSCDQLLHIVNDIIDISKIESGQIDLLESEFELNELLNEEFQLYSQAAKDSGVELIMKPFIRNGNNKVMITSDRIKLHQVLDNLLNNALKFTHSGSIIFEGMIKKGFIQFEVADTGIGIQEDHQGVIFDRFRQVESSYTKKYSGTGLGLSISKAYIEKMGGTIWVSSELGKGSRFCFTLPFKPLDGDEVELTNKL